MFKFFEVLPDPRVERTRRHDLVEVIAITILAAVCGADDWPEVWEFASSREQWLRTFLELRSGVPSLSTFRRIFRALDGEAFRMAFMEWTKSLVEATAGKLVAIDGKTLRRSFQTPARDDALHVVSAWVVDNHVVFGQVATDSKSNEITAIPRLLELLHLKGATVTIDAMGCQTKIAEGIIDKGADYILAVKDNQPTLAQDVESAFATADIADEQQPPSYRYEETAKSHGRVERRRVTVLDAADRLGDQKRWRCLHTIIRVESFRMVGDKSSTEMRYYISSVQPDAALLARQIRDHWRIENEQHWSLDVMFREDESRIRSGNGPANFGTIRRIALNLIKNERSEKKSIKVKRKRAGWDDEYLFRVLQANAETDRDGDGVG